jgi:hypothetical protein
MSSWRQWCDLPAILASGARIVTVRQLAGADTEIVMVLKELTMDQAQQKSEMASKLTQTLATMLASARSTPGKVIRQELAHGMRIDIIRNRDGEERMQLSRPTVYPSDQEIQTVIKHWPEDNSGFNYLGDKRFESGGRCYIQVYLTAEKSEVAGENGQES